MPPIRASPWTNHAELAQLYAWIWEEPEDEVATARAVARIATYLPHPSTPLFLPLLHALLTTTLLPHPPTTSQQLLTTRLALSSSLIRFINSLVDPLQTTAYAKPISLLARQLRIPPSLVAVRHAATHEDLPTYEALRAGIDQAIEWVRMEIMAPLVFPQQQNANNPDLNGDNSSQVNEKEEQEYLALVKKYKSLLRAFYRERTSTNTALWSGARELRMTLRALEDKLDSLVSREGGGSGDSESKREEQARWLVRSVLFAERGGLVPNARKRPSYNASTGFPNPGEAEIRIWTPLLALIADKFAAVTTETDGDRYNDNDNEGESRWSAWCLSEGLRVVLSYIETRDGTQLDSPFASRAGGQSRELNGGKGKEVVPFAHDADYLGLPDEEEEEEGQATTAVAESADVAGDAKQDEKEEFMACLVGWLALLVQGNLTTTSNSTTTRNTITVTGKRRRSGQLGDSLPLEISAKAAPDNGTAAWSVGVRGRRQVCREVVKSLGIDVVRDAWELFLQEEQESEQEELVEAMRQRKLVRKEDLLLLLIRGDPVCEALVRRLAEADEERNQVQGLSDEDTEQRALESMEHRLEAFRKMMMLRQGQISLQRQRTAIDSEAVDDDVSDDEAGGKRMRGWARVDGWKECPFGFWRG